MSAQPRAPTVQEIYDNIPNLKKPIMLTGDSRDMFIEKSPDAVDDDLYGQARAVLQGLNTP